MFSPKRSSERKADKKAKLERYRQISGRRDNNIKLNLLGVPKDQVSVKKTHQEDKNENLFKISIDTENKAAGIDKTDHRTYKYENSSTPGYSSEDSTGGLDKPRVLGGKNIVSTKPGKKTPNSDVCLTLPGEKVKEIKIVQRPNEASFKNSSNIQTYYNLQPDIRPNRIVQKSSGQCKESQGNLASIPDLEKMQRNTQNKRNDQPVDSRIKKQGPKQVGFSDYDAVYGTGSEQSSNYSDDDMPFDRRSPMVYQVGGTMAESGFGGIDPKQSPKISNTDSANRGVAHPPEAYSKEPFKSQENPKQLDVTPSLLNKALANHLAMDGNMNPESDGQLKEQPSLKDSIGQSSLNVIGERHPDSRSRNVTKPLMVDREIMTDRSSLTTKGNISNVETSLSKQLPVVRDPSKESMDSNKSFDFSKPRKSLVSSIPKPDFGLFRRPKTPKSTAEHGNDHEVQSVPSNLRNEDGNTKASNRENAVAVDHKTPKKLTPISVKGRNYKPIFFPADTKDDFENWINPYQIQSRNVADGKLEEKGSNPGEVKTPKTAVKDLKGFDGEAQTRDNVIPLQDKSNEGTSDEISIQTFPLKTMSDELRFSGLLPIDKMESLSKNINLNKPDIPLVRVPSIYETPIQSRAYTPVKGSTTTIDKHGDKRAPVEDRFLQSVANQYNEPYSSEGYDDSEPSYGILENEDDRTGAPVDENIERALANGLNSIRPPTDVFSPSENTLDHSKSLAGHGGQKILIDSNPSTAAEHLLNVLMMNDNLSPQSSGKLTEQPSSNGADISPLKRETSSKTSFHEPTNNFRDRKEVENLSFSSGFKPNNYASTGAIPRIKSALRLSKGSKGSLVGGQVWPSVGERLSKKGSPFIETIQEEVTDDMGRPLHDSGSNTNQTVDKNGLDHKSATDTNYVRSEDNDNIDKDRTNIMAFHGHLADGTPFSYNQSAPDAYPLNYTHSDNIQHENSTSEDKDVTRQPARESKASRKGLVPKKEHKNRDVSHGRSADNLSDRKEIGKSGFYHSAHNEIIYLGKLPNTSYNVFYSPDEAKGLNEIESKTTVPIKSEKMLTEGPKGILIFVNKKNDHKCPFKMNGYSDNRSNLKGISYDQYDDHYASPNYNGDVQPRKGLAESRRVKDPQKDRKVTVERTSKGKIVTEEFPCGCYKIITYDLAGELQTEEFTSALCTEGNLCVVAHPELIKDNKGIAYRSYEMNPLNSKDTDRLRTQRGVKATKEDGMKRRHPKYDFSDNFPGIEVIAKAVVNKKGNEAKPPALKMKSADLLASFKFKSDKYKGLCNLHFDPRLKRYLREILPSILADDERTKNRHKRLS